MRQGLATAIVLLSVIVSAQDTGVLRIRVVLTNADGSETPIPRAQLLISDNPATQEPRRVRTGADGMAEIKLPGGNYTVESDVPVNLGGQAYEWTKTLDVPAGRETTLTLTNANADATTAAAAATGRASATSGDGAVIFQRWRNSVVEIWSETAHATGFVIDARGLIATNALALSERNESKGDVEVQFDASLKVPGRVVATDAAKGVTIVWIDPATTAARPPIAPACADATAPAVTRDQKIFALAAPMLEPKISLLGTISRVATATFDVDWRLDSGSAGGPVFAADGKAVGITVADEGDDRTQRKDSTVIPLSNACSVIAAAAQKISGATPPPATALRTEAGVPPHRIRKIGEVKGPQVQPPVIRAGDFDIALLTPAMTGGELSVRNPRSFFGAWEPYVMSAPQVLLMRVTPQFEESVWKLLARGAARTQGVDLPPMPSFGSNFLRMRAFCGINEVAPIHRLIIETAFDSAQGRPLEGRRPLREGLYVFALTDFGPQCAPVRVEMFSEKSPNRADVRTIDTALFAQVAKIN